MSTSSFYDGLPPDEPLFPKSFSERRRKVYDVLTTLSSAGSARLFVDKETVRSMRWDGTRDNVDQIVAWVRSEGGEAHYEPDFGDNEDIIGTPYPRIAVRAAYGMTFASPGDTVNMTDEWVGGEPDGSGGWLSYGVRVFSVEAS